MRRLSFRHLALEDLKASVRAADQALTERLSKVPLETPDYCSACEGPLSTVAAIHVHNIRCAETGERSYPRPSLRLQVSGDDPSDRSVA